VRELVASHELIHQLVVRDLRVRYQQAVMGFAWAIFMPLLVVLSGTIVRLAMATMSGGALEGSAIASTAVKGLAWSFFAGALGTATQSLLANSSLITKLHFPRESLPLSTILAQAFDTLIGAAVVAALLPFLGTDVSLALLWVPVIAVLMFLLVLAVSLLTSCANLFFRDVKYIVQMLLTFGIFVTPVFVEPSMLGARVGRLIMLNPVSPLLEALRLSVIEGHNLMVPIVTTSKGVEFITWSPWFLLYSAMFAVVGLIVSMRIFRRAAVLFAEYA
jgi:lipopolysaccharide transport system permease protein